MNTPRKLLAILVAVVTLIIAATVGTFAGSKLVEGNIGSFVVDINQAVPVEITAPIELDSGEVVTVTAPVTVNVQLRVAIDGKDVAKVIKDSVQEPLVTITNTETSAPSEAVEIRDLAWRITDQKNLGQNFEWASNSYYSYTSSGNFIGLNLAIENIGSVPAEHIQDYKGTYGGVEVQLIDERGRQFGEMDYKVAWQELCEYAKINPGITANCVMFFDVPSDVKSLTLRLSKDDQSVEIPLTVR